MIKWKRVRNPRGPGAEFESSALGATLRVRWTSMGWSFDVFGDTGAFTNSTNYLTEEEAKSRAVGIAEALAPVWRKR